MRTMLTITAAIALLALPAAAQVWVEAGDAGDLPISAQLTDCGGALVVITGSIAAANDVDLYCILITDPATFSATTCGATTMDTALWLFDTDGYGVSFNNDDPGGCGLQSTLTDQFLPGMGQYFLAISLYGRDAANGAGLDIWLDAPNNTERAPDGPGAPGPVMQWVGATTLTGTYSIILTGTGCCGPVATETSTWGTVKDLYR